MNGSVEGLYLELIHIEKTLRGETVDETIAITLEGQAIEARRGIIAIVILTIHRFETATGERSRMQMVGGI